MGAQADCWLCFRGDGLAAMSYETEPTAFTWTLHEVTLPTRVLTESSSRLWGVTVSPALEEMPVGDPLLVLRFPVMPRGPGLGPDRHAHVDPHVPVSSDGFLNRFAQCG